MIIDSNDERPRQRTAGTEAPVEVEAQEAPPEKPRRERKKAAAPPAPPVNWKYWAWGGAAVFGLLLFLWIGSKIDEFLATDPRFALALPEEAGEASPNLQIIGLKRSDPQEILKVFAGDVGKSIYLVPLAERRDRLTKVDWIRDAAVLRIWPNRVQVQLTERVPAASLHLPPTPRDLELGHEYHLALIDTEGAILTPYGEARALAPEVTGISAETPIEDRKMGVQRVVRLMKESGIYRDRIARVDAADPNNLKVYQPFMGREIVLLIGHEKYFERLENYFNNIDKLPQQADIPGFDLRPENQIVAMSPPPKTTAKAEEKPE